MDAKETGTYSSSNPEVHSNKTIEALQERVLKMRALTDSVQEAIFMIDSNGITTYVNSAAQKLFGYSSEELLGKDLHQMLAPQAYQGAHNKTFAKFVKTGEGAAVGKTVELTALKKTGEEFPIELSISSVKLKGEWNAVGVIRDISERNKALEKMQNDFRNQITLASILQVSLQDVTFEEQLELTLTLIFSLPWLNITTKGSIFLVDEESKSLVLKAHRGLHEEILSRCGTVPFGRCLCGKAALTGETVFKKEIDNEHTTTYDGIEPHGHYIVPIISEGKVIGIINLYLDAGHAYSEDEVTFLEAVANSLSSLIKRKRVEEEREKLWGQFLQSQKMESIGRLTGGIAHDFNNLLAAIIGYADLAIGEASEDTPLWEYLNIIIEAGEKSTKLVQQLLAFSRKQVLEIKQTNLSKVVEKLSKMLTRMIGEDIKLKLNLNSVENVLADETQMEQVLLNLAVNARHAMLKGGTLTIETGDVVLDENSTVYDQEVKPGAYVKLSVIDTGVGMSADMIKKIFEPFFTTKAIGEGTGLGLSTVFGLIKQHNGFIDVTSEEGNGSKFDIYLPVSHGEVSEVVTEEKIATFERGHETILVVDDEEIVLHMVSDVLRSMEYETLMAGNAEEALKIYNAEKDKIALIVTDIVMTGMNGWELYQEIKKTNPDVKIVFMSGYMDNTAIIEKIKEEDKIFINKPARPRFLAKKIREELDKDF